MREQRETNFDLDQLLHPARGYGHPNEVLRDPDLTLNEKRAVLASWASDACAVEAAPALRVPPGGRPVRFDDILDALRELDRQVSSRKVSAIDSKFRRALRRERIFGRRRGHGDTDQGRPMQCGSP